MPARVDGAARGQRMLEQRQQRLRRERPERKRGEAAEQDPRRGQRQRAPRAVVGAEAPARQLGGHPSREFAVGRNQRRARSRLGGFAQDERDRPRLGARAVRLDPDDVRQRLGDRRGQRPAFAAPLVGDRRRAQRQRREPVARGRRRARLRPRRNGAGIEAERVRQPPEARLRMVRGVRLVGTEPVPDPRGQLRVEAGQHQRALRQPGDRRHERAGRPARAGRSRDDHRMRRGRDGPDRPQRIRDGAHSALSVDRGAGGGVVAEDREKAQAAPPMLCVLRRIECGKRGGRDAFALHLVEKVAQAVGEIEGRGRRREVRLGAQHRPYEAGELKLAPELRGRRGEVQRPEWIGAEFGDDADARQQAGRSAGEFGDERPARPLGVDPDLDPRQRLRRRAAETRLKPCDKRAGEVDPGRQREDPGPVSRGKQRHRASSASASASPSGRPTSTQPPVHTRPNRRPSARSASQTRFSEKAPSGNRSSASVSMIWAPA